MKRKPPPFAEQLTRERDDMYDAIKDEAPLPCVLITVSCLETAVGSLLRRHLIDDDESHALLTDSNFLGSFRMRARMAFCLGLISKPMYDNLKYFGDIRNQFAHSYVALDFSNQDIKNLCMNLKHPTVHRKLAAQLTHLGLTGDKEKDERTRFIFVALATFQKLIALGLHTEHRKKASGAEVSLPFFT